MPQVGRLEKVRIAGVGPNLLSHGTTLRRVPPETKCQERNVIPVRLLDREPVDDSPDERARLVAAAWTVLRRSGFDGFKVQLVLREAGLSARTFYRHFSDKDSLMLALVEDEYGATSRRLRKALSETDSDPAAQVSAWIRELLLSASDPVRVPRTRLFSAYYPMMGRAPGALSRASLAILEPLEAAIRLGQHVGEFGGTDFRNDALQISRLTGGAISDHLAHGGGTDIDDLILSTVEFALRALRSGAAPSARRQ